MIDIFTAAFLGWNLGANDAANIFGTAVSNRIIKFMTAAIIASVFVIIGALVGGEEGIRTYQKISAQNNIMIPIAITLSASISVFIMTTLKIPVSTTHSILAGLIVSGLFQDNLNIRPLMKMILSWFLSPLGSMLFSYVFYSVFSKFFRRRIKNIIVFENVIKAMAIVIGIYGSYSLGANNVANVVGVFAKNSSLSIRTWLLIGGFSIALGIITYSKKVMLTVGANIAKLDNFGALIAVLATSIIVHIFSLYGVPVSSSQGIVGGVIGIGLTEGIESLDLKVIKRVVKGWIYSICISGFLCYIMINIFL